MAKRIDFFSASQRADYQDHFQDMRRPTADKLADIAIRSPKDREALETIIDEVLRRLDATQHPHAV